MVPLLLTCSFSQYTTFDCTILFIMHTKNLDGRPWKVLPNSCTFATLKVENKWQANSEVKQFTFFDKETREFDPSRCLTTCLKKKASKLIFFYGAFSFTTREYSQGYRGKNFKIKIRLFITFAGLVTNFQLFSYHNLKHQPGQ